MKWHFDFDQHTNQVGFSLTVAYLNVRELDGTSLAGSMACVECGIDTPQVQLEVTILMWTMLLIGHSEINA